MLSFPASKINIGLQVIGKRNDGYHDLETVFYPVAVKDALEITDGDNNVAGDVIFTITGTHIDGADEDNLCVKAYRLLKKDYPQIPSVKMHLHKHIPMGAGLGGGSADAAGVLMLLNKKFALNISATQLMKYALLLGSDCPFFILNKPCFAAGRGEILEEIAVDLLAFKILIVHPGIHVNTKETFTALSSSNYSEGGALKKAIAADIGTWKENIKNDFEIPVFSRYPQIKEIKEKLYENGAVYSAMSGTGSAVYGIFPQVVDINFQFPSHYFCQLV